MKHMYTGMQHYSVVILTFECNHGLIYRDVCVWMVYHRELPADKVKNMLDFLKSAEARLPSLW